GPAGGRVPDGARPAGVAGDGRAVPAEGPLRGRAVGPGAGRVAEVPQTLLQGVHTFGERERRFAAGEPAGPRLPRRAAARPVVSEARERPHRRRHREANPRGDRWAGRGDAGGVGEPRASARGFFGVAEVSEDEAFIRAVVDGPGDDTPRLVYADW